MSDKPNLNLSEEAIRAAYPDCFIDPHLNPDADVRKAATGDKPMGTYITPKSIEVIGHNYSVGAARSDYVSKATVQLTREGHWRRFKKSFTRVDRWFRVKVACGQAAESLGQYLKLTWKLWTGNYTVTARGHS